MNKHEFDFTGVPGDEAVSMIVEMQRKIDYITSGARDKYNARVKLAENFEKWGRSLVKELKELDLIDHINTNYSSWEYRVKGYKLDLNVYYNMPMGRSDGFSVKSEEEFAAIMGYRGDDGKYVSIFIKSVEEFKSVIEAHQDRKW